MRTRRRAGLGLAVLACAALSAGCSDGGDALAGVLIPTATPSASPTLSTGETDLASANPSVPSIAPTPLGAGQRPPQFVVVSFDGAGSLDAWQRWRDVSTRTGAHVTYFLSGTYLLPTEKASLYHPPHHPAGTSTIGFSNPAEIRARMEFVRQAYLAGDEIGTHFNGHFCADEGSNSWTTADWADEIAQFDTFLRDWRTNAGALDAPPTPFGPEEVVGERTPCLEGSMDALFPALKARGFRYDSSGDHGPLAWPTQDVDGLWTIPMQALRLADDGTRVLSMDWNFYAEQSGAEPAAASRFPALRAQVLATYRNAFDSVYAGNRAPLILGNHFNTWNGGIYADALQSFVEETCGRPEVRCVSFLDLVNWLEAQPASVRARLAALPSQEMKY